MLPPTMGIGDDGGERGRGFWERPGMGKERDGQRRCFSFLFSFPWSASIIQPSNPVTLIYAPTCFPLPRQANFFCLPPRRAEFWAPTAPRKIFIYTTTEFIRQKWSTPGGYNLPSGVSEFFPDGCGKTSGTMFFLDGWAHTHQEKSYQSRREV